MTTLLLLLLLMINQDLYDSIPSTKAIVKRYTKDVSWRTYRKRVLVTLRRERTGLSLAASLPATSKGSTGWARWPGFDPLATDKSIMLSEHGGRSQVDGFSCFCIFFKF
jgi:hypothetical protein